MTSQGRWTAKRLSNSSLSAALPNPSSRCEVISVLHLHLGVLTQPNKARSTQPKNASVRLPTPHISPYPIYSASAAAEGRRNLGMTPLQSYVRFLSRRSPASSTPSATCIRNIKETCQRSNWHLPLGSRLDRRAVLRCSRPTISSSTACGVYNSICPLQANTSVCIY